MDAFQGWEEIVKAKENDEILEGVVSAVVKGGVVAVTNGSRVFIPASQTGVPRNQELDVLKGTTVRFRIIDINPARRRAVGSIKVVANEERKAQQDALWATLEEGQKLTGTVKSLTSYGAFVDIGGMDGMIHIASFHGTESSIRQRLLMSAILLRLQLRSLTLKQEKFLSALRSLRTTHGKSLREIIL